MATSHYILVLLSVVAVLASSSVASRGPGANNSRDIQGLGGNNDSHCIRGKTTGTTTTNGASGQGQNNEHDHYDDDGNNNKTMTTTTTTPGTTTTTMCVCLIVVSPYTYF
jgi:hypothetical protein